MLRANGAIALRWTGSEFALSAARPPSYQRPWARSLPVSAPAGTGAGDATPRPGDLEAAD
jgi:hypothetical protein